MMVVSEFYISFLLYPTKWVFLRSLSTWSLKFVQNDGLFLFMNRFISISTDIRVYAKLTFRIVLTPLYV